MDRLLAFTVAVLYLFGAILLLVGPPCDKFGLLSMFAGFGILAHSVFSSDS